MALLIIALSYIIDSTHQISNYTKKNYFYTNHFQQDTVDYFLNTLTSIDIEPIDVEALKKNITVTQEEIHDYRYYYGSLEDQIQNIKEQYEEKINISKQANDTEMEKKLLTEQNEKIKDITRNFTDDTYVKEKIIKAKENILATYSTKVNTSAEKAQLDEEKEILKYYLKNKQTGKIYTNLSLSTNDTPKDILKKDDLLFHTHYDSFYSNPYLPIELDTEGSGIYVSNVFDSLSTADYEVDVYILKNASVEHPLMQAYNNYNQSRLLFLSELSVAIIILLLSFFYLKKRLSLQTFEQIPQPAFYKRLPIDVQSAIFFTFICISILCLNMGYYSVESYLHAWNDSYIIDLLLSQAIEIAITVAVVLTTWIQGVWIYGFFKQTKDGKQRWEHTFTKQLVTLAKSFFLNRPFGMQLFFALTVIFLGGVGAIAIITPLVLVYIPLFLFIFLPTLYMIMKQVSYFNLITETTTNLAEGYKVKDIPVKGKSTLTELAQNINALKNNVSLSQQKEAKSERLKTELISNVSHDLRTPLTSIITYADLLKSPDLTEDERNTYIEIIDRKSQRLKVLIEDLFEASKMATGNIELNKERVDIAQLLRQSLAELDDKIQDSSLQFRSVIKEEPLYVTVDGRKIWRVFDNLLHNILKYSLDHSRVYITLAKEANQVVITFKNISKYELGIEAEELFERFKRGDTSRHTEGSGLGLAIAKSIIDLHDGQMTIDTDGDLFTVQIVLPIATA